MTTMLVASTINTLFQILFWLILARVLLSWISPGGMSSNAIIQDIATAVYTLTEPIFQPIRRVMPQSSMGIDFTPLVAILLLELIHSLVMQLI